MKNTHLIIGNGFNLALKELLELSNGFNIRLGYQDIIKDIKQKLERESSLRKFIEKAENQGICDVEFFLHILESSEKFLPYENEIYIEYQEKQYSLIREDIKKLKDAFIDVITDENNHPEWSSIFGNSSHTDMLETCARNLQKFDRVFTINYDLILYWLMNNQNILKTKRNPGAHFVDGFRNKKSLKPTDIALEFNNHLAGCFTENIKINLFYLHGAIHFLKRLSPDDPESTYKVIKGYYDSEICNDVQGLHSRELQSDKIILLAREKEKGWYFKTKTRGEGYFKDQFPEELSRLEGKKEKTIKHIAKEIIVEKLFQEGTNEMRLINLREVLKQSLNELGFDNLIILEGGSEKKINRIFDNIYLRKCYDKLLTTHGKIVIYGCNILKDGSNEISDQHIWKRIIANSQEIFLSVYPKDDNMELLVNQIMNFFKQMKVRKKEIKINFFDSREINIWREDFQQILNKNINFNVQTL